MRWTYWEHGTSLLLSTASYHLITLRSSPPISLIHYCLMSDALALFTTRFLCMCLCRWLWGSLPDSQASNERVPDVRGATRRRKNQQSFPWTHLYRWKDFFFFFLTIFVCGVACMYRTLSLMLYICLSACLSVYLSVCLSVLRSALRCAMLLAQFSLSRLI